MYRLAFIVVLFASLPAVAEESIAVMPLGSKTVDPDKVSVLDNLVVTAVSEIGKYRVISAADINAMLGLERMKEAVGCTDLACAAEIGGALGAGFLLTGTVDILGSELIFTATLLDVAKAEAIARKKLRIKNDENKYYDGVETLVAMVFGLKLPAGGGATASAGSPFLGSSADGASVTVTSDAPGRIFLDGHDTEHATPYVFSGVPAGSHTVEVVGPGKRGRAKLVAEARGEHTVHVAWSEDVTGSVRVDASVPGASVYFDGKNMGDVPQLISGVATGTHRVEVTAGGYTSWEDIVEVPADGIAEVHATLNERRAHAIAPRFFIRMGTWVETDTTCNPDSDDSADDYCRRTDAFNIGALIDYRWAHSEMLALRLRLGIGSMDTLDGTDGDTTTPWIALVGVSEVFSIPLIHSVDPMATVSPHPFAINFSGGIEAVVGGVMAFRALGSAGFQLWWLYADFVVGVQFAGDSEYVNFSDESKTSALDPLVMGGDIGLTFSF